MPQLSAIEKPLLVGVIFLGTFLAFANIPLVQAICLPGQNKIWSQNCPVAGRPNLEVCSNGMNKTAVNETIVSLFPESQRPHPSFIESVPVKLVLAKSGYVNVTFVYENAWFRNSLGIFVWDDATKRITRNVTLFPDVSFWNDGTWSDGCLDIGDTVSVGPFERGDILGFYVARHGFVQNPAVVWYSWFDDSAPQLKPVDGQQHSAWATLSNLGIFLLGFEDQSKTNNADFDFNDVMFTFTADLVREPPSTDCFPPAQITSDVYALHDCFEWTILRTDVMQTYCKFPIAIPSGYQLAPDDAVTRAAILAFGAAKWSSSAECLVIGNTTEVGAAVDSSTANPCSSATPAIRRKLAEKTCYSAPCAHRILLKSIKPIQSCSSMAGKVCVPGQPNAISSRAPEQRKMNEIWPFVANVDLKPSSPVLNVAIEIPLDMTAFDIVVAIDLAGVNSGSLSALLTQISIRLPFLFNNQTVKVALVEIRPNTSPKITPLSNPSVFSTLPITPSPASPNPLFLSQLRSVLLDSAVGWSTKAYRAAVVLSDNTFDVSSASIQGLVDVQLWRGVVPVFLSSKENSTSFNNFVQVASGIAVAASKSCPKGPDTISFASFADQAVPIIKQLTRNIQVLPVVNDGEKFGLVRLISQPIRPVPASQSMVIVNVPVAWDDSFVPTPSNIPVVSIYTIPGWRANATTINMFMNRRPIARFSQLDVVVPVHVPWTPVVLSVDDPDENILVAWVSAPVPSDKFSIKLSESSSPIQPGTNFTSLSFGAVPNTSSSFRGTERVHFTISDGCLSTYVDVVVNITSARNRPPVSEDVFAATLVDVPVKVTLKFWDPDVDSIVQAEIVDVSAGLGVFYHDSDLTHPVTEGDVLASNYTASLYYVPPSGQISKNGFPLGRLQYRAVDQHGSRSQISVVSVVVRSRPVVLKTSFSTPEDVELIISTKSMDIVVDQNGADNSELIVKLESNVERGRLQVCSSSGDCVDNAATYVGQVLTSSTGNLRFIPAKDEFGSSYASFRVSYTDRYSSTVYATLSIEVTPVNDPPVISADFPADGLVIKEGEVLPLNWQVLDIDSAPESLVTIIKIQPRTRHGWTLFTCPSNVSCVSPLALLAGDDHTEKTAISPGDLILSNCGDVFSKGLPVQVFSACHSDFFKLFAPAPDAYAYQFASIILTARDGEGGLSAPVVLPIAVTPVNDNPTIIAPTLVEFTVGSLRDKVKAGDVVVAIADIDASPRFPELLTIAVVDGANGTLIFPPAETRRCSVSGNTWECRDTIPSFNSWLPELQFEFSSSIDKNSSNFVVLNFTINDLGNTGDNFVPQLTASASSRIVYTPPPALLVAEAPTSFTAWAGAAAGLGLLLVAGATWLLRKKLTSQASNEYFAQENLNNSQANPLYAPAATEGINPLYK